MTWGCPGSVLNLGTWITFTANNISKLLLVSLSFQCGAFLRCNDLLVVRAAHVDLLLCLYVFFFFFNWSLHTCFFSLLPVAFNLIFCLHFCSNDKYSCNAILCCCIAKKMFWTCWLVNCCILNFSIKKVWFVKAEETFPKLLRAL